MGRFTQDVSPRPRASSATATSPAAASTLSSSTSSEPHLACRHDLLDRRTGRGRLGCRRRQQVPRRGVGGARGATGGRCRGHPVPGARGLPRRGARRPRGRHRGWHRPVGRRRRGRRPGPAPGGCGRPLRCGHLHRGGVLRVGRRCGRGRRAHGLLDPGQHPDRARGGRGDGGGVAGHGGSAARPPPDSNGSRRGCRRRRLPRSAERRDPRARPRCRLRRLRGARRPAGRRPPRRTARAGPAARPVDPALRAARGRRAARGEPARRGGRPPRRGAARWPRRRERPRRLDVGGQPRDPALPRRHRRPGARPSCGRQPTASTPH